jgi:uncharacterized protein with PIN domain
MAPARFLTDTSLELLARRLRFLGYDVRTVAGARFEELLEAGRAEERTVLTLSARHPKRFQDVACIQVPRNDPAGAVRQIAAAHEPASLPFSRCPHCNHALQKRHTLEAHGEVPGRVLRASQSLHYCPICAKWFWFGTHVSRMCEWLSQAVGRDITWPHDPLDRNPLEPSGP